VENLSLTIGLLHLHSRLLSRPGIAFLGMFDSLRKKLSALGLRQIKRVIIFVVGMTVLLLGVVLIVLPGPAIIVIPAGLAILGVEFQWARRWLRKAREIFTRAGRNKISRREEVR
jgi:uncharacterized protein (TIGR02611 family)